MEYLNAILIVLLLVCLTADLQSGRIPNVITVSGFAAGLAARTALGGLQAVPDALLAAMLPLALLFPFWLLTGGKGIGGGDLKMFAAVGVYLPVEALLPVGLVTFGSAAVCGFFIRAAALFGPARPAGGNPMLSSAEVPAVLPGAAQHAQGLHLAFFTALAVLLHIDGLC